MRTGPIKSTTIVALGAAGLCIAPAPASAQFAGFGPPTILSAGPTDAPQAVVIGDYDGDGDNDLAVAYTGSDKVAIFFNNGVGSFPGLPSTVNVGQGPISIVTGDLDLDTDLDLATANAIGDNVSILKNNGLAIFTNFGAAPVVDAPQSLAIADLDGNGSPDAVVAFKGNQATSGGMAVFLNQTAANAPAAFNLSDPSLEKALLDIVRFRRFTDLSIRMRRPTRQLSSIADNVFTK